MWILQELNLETSKISIIKIQQKWSDQTEEHSCVFHGPQPEALLVMYSIVHKLYQNISDKVKL